MKKVTKTVYVVDGREYDNASDASLAARAKRLEDLLDKLADDNDLFDLHAMSYSLARAIINNADRLIAAINDPVPVEDEVSDMLKHAYNAVHNTPETRLAARRTRVAAQDKTSTQPCACANQDDPLVAVDTYHSDATGCEHCNVCGGVRPKLPASVAAGIVTQEEATRACADFGHQGDPCTACGHHAFTPRHHHNRNMVRDSQRATDNKCTDCGSRFTHAQNCRYYVK